jgi:hypothetical protein
MNKSGSLCRKKTNSRSNYPRLTYHMEQAFLEGFKLGAQLMLEVLEVGKDACF